MPGLALLPLTFITILMTHTLHTTLVTCSYSVVSASRACLRLHSASIDVHCVCLSYLLPAALVPTVRVSYLCAPFVLAAGAQGISPRGISFPCFFCASGLRRRLRDGASGHPLRRLRLPHRVRLSSVSFSAQCVSLCRAAAAASSALSLSFSL